MESETILTPLAALLANASFEPEKKAKILFFQKPQGVNLITFKKLIENAIDQQLKLDAKLITDLSSYAGQGILATLQENTDTSSIVGSVITINYGIVHPQAKSVTITDKLPNTAKSVSVKFQNIPFSHRSEEKFTEFCTAVATGSNANCTPTLLSANMQLSPHFGLPDSIGTAVYEYLPQSLFEICFQTKKSQGFLDATLQDAHHPRFVLPSKDFCKICSCTGHDSDLCYATNAGALNSDDVMSPAKKSHTRQCSVLLKNNTSMFYKNGVFVLENSQQPVDVISTTPVSPFQPSKSSKSNVSTRAMSLNKK
jgi:hypothetical protein